LSSLEEITTREEIISALKAQEMLNSNISELESLCRKTSLRPRKDEFGNVYFSKNDVDILKKVKELYSNSQKLEQKVESKEINKESAFIKASEKVREEVQEIQQLRRAETFELPATIEEKREVKPQARFELALGKLEETILSRMESLLSEKMDGLDEVILELIRSKTENENLRQKLNELNKENYSLKKEVNSYKPIAMGLYLKSNNQDF
jgi:hypothetical protein